MKVYFADGHTQELPDNVRTWKVPKIPKKTDVVYSGAVSPFGPKVEWDEYEIRRTTDGRFIAVILCFLACLLTFPLHADDGRSLVPLMENRPIFSPWRDVVLVEHFEGVNHDSTDAIIPTYTELVTADFVYVTYSTGEEELYNMVADPYQLENIALVTPDATMNLYRVVAAQMKICEGSDCFKRMPRTVVLPALTRPRVYPNPFNPETRIEFDYQGEVNLKIFNVLGQEVWNWQGLWPGQVVFDGARLSSGIYFCHVKCSQTFVERMVMIR